MTGSIQIRNFEDNSGQKRTYVDIVADDVEFLTPKGSSNSAASADAYAAPAAPRKHPTPAAFAHHAALPLPPNPKH